MTIQIDETTKDGRMISMLLRVNAERIKKGAPVVLADLENAGHLLARQLAKEDAK